MNRIFKAKIDLLHKSFSKLVTGNPHRAGGHLPKQGVYLFREGGVAIYVGRSNNVSRRYRQHRSPSSSINQASLAALIARQELGIVRDYTKGARTRLLENQEFCTEFSKAKERISMMEFYAVEEKDQTIQALLEIYCAISLETPYNFFETH